MPTGKNGEMEISPLVELLEQEDEEMQSLFAKALNLYVSPNTDALSESEKLARLRQFIEDSVKI